MAELDLELDREQRRSEPTSVTAQRSRGHIRGRQTCMENDLGVSVRFGSYLHHMHYAGLQFCAELHREYDCNFYKHPLEKFIQIFILPIHFSYISW